jgi:hypothetical protein
MYSAESSTGELADDTTRKRYNYQVGLFMKDEELRQKTPPKPVCQTAFKIIYEIGKKKLARLQSSINEVVLIRITLFSITFMTIVTLCTKEHRC